MKAAAKPRNFVRFRYPLSDVDSLLIRSHEDADTSIGPYDLGFVIERDGRAMKRESLQNLPEFRDEDSFFSQAFTTLYVTQACASGGPIYFITMKYMATKSALPLSSR